MQTLIITSSQSILVQMFQYIETFTYICHMKRRIISFGKYFGEFMNKLTEKEREKVDYGLVLLKTQDRFNGFHKKTQKTPEGEISKALKIKEEYYESFRRNKWNIK